jgi:hypothetical protein
MQVMNLGCLKYLLPNTTPMPNLYETVNAILKLKCHVFPGIDLMPQNKHKQAARFRTYCFSWERRRIINVTTNS